MYQLLTKDKEGTIFDHLFNFRYKINKSALLLSNRFFFYELLMLTLHLSICMRPQKHFYRRQYFVISPSEGAKLVHCKSPLGHQVQCAWKHCIGSFLLPGSLRQTYGMYQHIVKKKQNLPPIKVHVKLEWSVLPGKWAKHNRSPLIFHLILTAAGIYIHYHNALVTLRLC